MVPDFLLWVKRVSGRLLKRHLVFLKPAPSHPKALQGSACELRPLPDPEAGEPGASRLMEVCALRVEAILLLEQNGVQGLKELSRPAGLAEEIGSRKCPLQLLARIA